MANEMGFQFVAHFLRHLGPVGTVLLRKNDLLESKTCRGQNLFFDDPRAARDRGD